jgi:hypothetical protein
LTGARSEWSGRYSPASPPPALPFRLNQPRGAGGLGEVARARGHRPAGGMWDGCVVGRRRTWAREPGARSSTSQYTGRRRITRATGKSCTGSPVPQAGADWFPAAQGRWEAEVASGGHCRPEIGTRPAVMNLTESRVAKASRRLHAGGDQPCRSLALAARDSVANNLSGRVPRPAPHTSHPLDPSTGPAASPGCWPLFFLTVLGRGSVLHMQRAIPAWNRFKAASRPSRWSSGPRDPDAPAARP